MTARPRVVHVISGLGPGGAEIMLLELVRESAASRFDPFVVCLANHTGLVPEFEKLGVPVVTLGLHVNSPDPRMVLRLMKILKAERPAVVQTWMYHANLIGGLAARASGNIPVSWGIHHTYLSPEYIKRPTLMVAKAGVPLSKRLPKAIVCCAEESRRVHAKLGYPSDKMRVIPNGFDMDRFKPDPEARMRIRAELSLFEETKLVGLLARFNPQKDHANFVLAAAGLAKRDPDVRFVLCGWDVTWENPTLAGWIDEVGMRDRFHLLGRRADTPAIHAALDVVALSSESGEAFPLVIGEAMATGTPCAVTDIGDSAMIVGDLGRVAPPHDPAALANAIDQLLTLSADERARVSVACRCRIADNYSLSEIAARYDRVWSEIASPVPEGEWQRTAPCV
jgi:glycosyltransferase involved in cell wall biosynthesis